MTSNYKQNLKEVRKEIKKLQLQETKLMNFLKKEYAKDKDTLFKGQTIEKKTHKKKEGINRTTIWRRLNSRRSSIPPRNM